MCVATITFEDLDQVKGQFRVNTDVKETSEDFASAAHVTAMFISKAVDTPQFMEGVCAYGHAKGWSMRRELPTTITLTLTDVDLEAGSFDLVVTEEPDAIYENSVTAAYMAACFVKDAMHSNEFRMAVTEFAYDLIAGSPGASVNEPTGPVAANVNTETPQEAA